MSPHAPEWWGGYRAGYSDGIVRAGGAQPDRSYLVPMPVPWRHVRARDAIRGDDGQSVWTIIRAGWARPIDPPPGTPADARVYSVIAQCGNERVPFEVDPDMMADVLIEVGHTDALALTIEQLGARLLATQRDPDGGHTGDLDWRGESTPLPSVPVPR